MTGRKLPNFTLVVFLSSPDADLLEVVWDVDLPFLASLDLPSLFTRVVPTWYVPFFSS